MSVTVKFDQRVFREGLRHKLALTKKTEVEVLNKALRDIALKSIRYTPKADAGKIRALDPKILAAAVAKKNPGRKWAPGEFAAAVKKEKARRVRSVGNIKAGFIKAAQEFGAAKNSKVSSKGNTGKGYGKKASASNLVAMGVNMANAAGQIAAPAVQKAMNEVGKDMAAYAPKQMAKHWI